MELQQHIETQLLGTELYKVVKDQKELKKEIEYYKRINKEIKQNVKILKRTKENFDLVFSILIWSSLIFVLNVTQLHAQFNPKDVSDLAFFVESNAINTTNHIAFCETNDCLNEANTEGAAIADQYCDVTNDCGEGCVRRWIDQSSYIPGTGFNPPEYTNGRNFGQDDSVKPCYISNCINGKPCIRGGGGVPFATDYTSQDKYLEIQISDFINLTGEFSIFLLARPVAQNEDWDYFGQSTDYFRHRYQTNYLQLRIHPNTVYRVTPDNSVTLNEWQLIEVHRDALNKITVYINGVDKTNVPSVSMPDIVLPGTFTIGYLFSAFKTNSKTGDEKSMHGDIAGFLVYDKLTSSLENNNIRSYFNTNYLGNVLHTNANKFLKPSIELYPNPTTESIQLKVKKSLNQDFQNKIPYVYDALGKKLNVQIDKSESVDEIQFRINLKNISQGFYLINFEGSITKFIKK